MSSVSSEAPLGAGTTRRERVRAQTVQDIKSAARQHLVAAGPGGVQLRPIARDLGMTAPALYRYFDSHEALLEALVADCYGEVAAVIEAEVDPARGDLRTRLTGSARAFRGWAIAHPAEFTLLFGSPIPGVAPAEESESHHQARRFGQAFGRLFAELWATQPFPVGEPLAPDLRALLEEYADHVGVPLPPEAIAVFLSCWVRLYGAVTMEVFGHLSFALDDPGPLFERELARMCTELGLSPAG